MTLAGAPVFGPQQFFDNNGDPVANGTVKVTVASSATLRTVYADSQLTTPITNPVQLDSAGMASFWIGTDAYDVVVIDSNSVPVPGASVISAVNLAQTLLPLLGNTFAFGLRGATTGYTVASTDNFITVNSSGTNPTVINLPAATRGLPVGIQNVGTNPVAITPHGSDSINALSASAVYTMPAAVSASQIFPSTWLLPDGTSNWRSTGAFPASTQVLALSGGVKIASGTIALDGSNPTPIVTGLTTVTSFNANVNSSVTPSNTGTMSIRYTASGGTVSAYAFLADGSASTATETIGWHATGT